MSHSNLGNLLAGLDRVSEAEEQYRKGQAIYEKLATDFPTKPKHRLDLAVSHNNLGALLAGRGQRAAAADQYRKSLAIYEKLPAVIPISPEHRLSWAGIHLNLGNLLGGNGQRAEAEVAYRKAQTIYEKLAAEYPAVPGYQMNLGNSYCNLSALLLGGDPDESLKWSRRAIDCLEAVLTKEPRSVKTKHFLRKSYSNRAGAYHQLKKFDEAAKAWDRAIALSPPAEQPEFRAGRATSRMLAGMVAEAVTEVAELTKLPNWSADHWYNFACAYSLASGKFADKKTEYGDRAMELLQKSVQSGYKQVDRMKKDSDFDPLRDRADFKKLVSDLEARSQS